MNEKIKQAIAKLEVLKVLNHHTIDEESWRIDEIIELFQENLSSKSKKGYYVQYVGESIQDVIDAYGGNIHKTIEDAEDEGRLDTCNFNILDEKFKLVKKILNKAKE